MGHSVPQNYRLNIWMIFCRLSSYPVNYQTNQLLRVQQCRQTSFFMVLPAPKRARGQVYHSSTGCLVKKLTSHNKEAPVASPKKQLGDWPRIAHQKWWIEVFEKWVWIPKNQKDATLFGTLIGIWFNWTWRFAEKDGKINAALETHPVWGCNVVVWGIPGSSARRPILPAASAPGFITCYDPHWLVRNIYIYHIFTTTP